MPDSSDLKFAKINSDWSDDDQYMDLLDRVKTLDLSSLITTDYVDKVT